SGAINQADPGNDNIEAFSSRGPTLDNRTKPDITAIDGVSVTGDGGFPSTFFGTSATSPHVGAIAALLLTCNPTLTHGQLADHPTDGQQHNRSAQPRGEPERRYRDPLLRRNADRRPGERERRKLRHRPQQEWGTGWSGV